MPLSTLADAFDRIGDDFSLAPFDTLLSTLIAETLTEQGKDKYRKGTILIPKLLVWLVLVLTLRRDLNYDKALNWLVSGFRWLTDVLPAKARIVADGAISHARVKLGWGVFRVLLDKLVAAAPPLTPDFHGRVTAVFDGSTGTMPDTEANVAAFGKPKARKNQAAFPQVRLMALLAVSARYLLDVAFAPYIGKKTGERALLLEILGRLTRTGLLLLLDAGLYSFEVLWAICQPGLEFICFCQSPPHRQVQTSAAATGRELSGPVDG